ncbi:MAG: DUF5615 family PIN-like protein [Haloferacaceae archaeon]
MLTLPLLFDEDAEPELCRRCEADGHDVERVAEVPELGRGAGDATVRDYADRTDRIVVTHDKGFATAVASSHRGVFYGPNQRLSAATHYRIVRGVCGSYDAREDLPSVVYLTEEWL